MLRLSILIPLLLGLVGCSSVGQDIPSSAGATRNICVLTSAEVEQYMGYPDTSVEPGQGEGGPTCGYADEDSGTIIRLNLIPFSATCEELRGSPNSQAISGVGEWAYWSDDRQRMYVKSGSNCLEVTGAPVGDPELDYLTSLTELARLTVSRL